MSSFSHILYLGDLLPVLGAFPFRFLLKLYVLPGLSIRPVLWLVPDFVTMRAAGQPRSGAVS